MSVEARLSYQNPVVTLEMPAEHAAWLALLLGHVRVSDIPGGLIHALNDIFGEPWFGEDIQVVVGGNLAAAQPVDEDFMLINGPGTEYIVRDLVEGLQE